MINHKCSFCGEKLIKVIGSNISCINKNCENYVNTDYEVFFANYFSYEDISDFDINKLPDSIKDEYGKDYDKYLFFSDRPDYITRFKYREMNNFTEDNIYRNNRTNIEKKFLEKDELKSYDLIVRKYELIVKGRELENINSQDALDFYKSILDHNLFSNDYYVYKKIVKLEKNLHKQLQYLKLFFYSGIYCNRYHYLWFLKKLYNLSLNIDISVEEIDFMLKKFKNKGFSRKNMQDDPIPIAEKFTSINDKLYIRTDEEYTYRQYEFELIEESSNLKQVNQYYYAAEILEDFVIKHDLKRFRLIKNICNIYVKIGDKDNFLKWAFRFYNKFGRYDDDRNQWFLNKFDELNINVNHFNNNGLFFDNNKYYLTKNDFKKAESKSLEINDYITLIKDKYHMILKGLELENTNLLDAIDYYKSILDHKLFKNDYYIYKSLMYLYDRLNKFEDEIDLIISFFHSGIYCDNYNYVLFLFQLKKLSDDFVVYDGEIDSCLKSFKNKSVVNRHLENYPVPIAERLVFNHETLNVLSAEEFYYQQDINVLDFYMQLYESNGMFKSANDYLKILINEYGVVDDEIFQQVCFNYQQLNDVESEKEIINHYLINHRIWNTQKPTWFDERFDELNSISDIPEPLKEPDTEVLYENNIDFLSFDEFKSNDEFTELMDKTLLKLKLRRQGWRLEFKNIEKAIEFYKSLLDSDLFKNDYYIYRKLVILYCNINDYELVYKTINDFFFSGIYCNRYQYIWFLHKLDNVSRVKYISDGELTELLKYFKENGFKNNVFGLDDVFLAERLNYKRSSLMIFSSLRYNEYQSRYELQEQANQLQLNGLNEDYIDILRNMVEKGLTRSHRDYMKLCHAYRNKNDLDNELEIIKLFLSNNNNEFSRAWFENRLKEVNNLIKDNLYELYDNMHDDDLDEFEKFLDDNYNFQ